MTALPEVLEKLERAVSLVADMTPGELTVYDANEGDGWPPRPLWCFKNEGYDSGDDAALQGSIHYGGKEDADAIVAAVNWLREHGPALLRDAGDAARYRWLRSDSADLAPLFSAGSSGSMEMHSGDELDAAIDAAMTGGLAD